MKPEKAIAVGAILIVLPFIFFDYTSPFYLRVLSVGVCAIGVTFLLYGLETLTKKKSDISKQSDPKMTTTNNYFTKCFQNTSESKYTHTHIHTYKNGNDHLVDDHQVRLNIK